MTKVFTKVLGMLVMVAFLVAGLEVVSADEPPAEFTLDCKIEGRKGDDVTELVVCGVRQAGEFAGALLLRAPTKPDPKWDAFFSTGSLRAVRGDLVYLRIHCIRLPRMQQDERGESFIKTSALKASDWEELGVTAVYIISQAEYLGIAAK